MFFCDQTLDPKCFDDDDFFYSNISIFSQDLSIFSFFITYINHTVQNQLLSKSLP